MAGRLIFFRLESAVVRSENRRYSMHIRLVFCIDFLRIMTFITNKKCIFTLIWLCVHPTTTTSSVIFNICVVMRKSGIFYAYLRRFLKIGIILCVFASFSGW